MNVGSLFSGIGGIDLGLERAGMRVVWQCESDPYCRAVLRKHWPGVPCRESVQALVADAESYGRTARDANSAGGAAREGSRQEHRPPYGGVDLICGGFPCQPVSLAGRRRAQDDERWLWPEFERVVRLLRPRYVLVENVPGLLTAGMGDVLGGLAALGYDAEWECVSAASVGAAHLRERVWIVAYPGGARRRQDTDRAADVADAEVVPLGAGLRSSEPRGLGRGRSGNGGSAELQDPDLGTVQPRRIWRRAPQADSAEWWAAEPDVGRVAHGVPSRLDRLAALGNAVVPQVAEWIGRRILEAEERIAA